MAPEPHAATASNRSQGAAIEDYFVEDRTFPPPADFAADALVTGAEIYDEAEADWQGFWARQAADLVSWYDEWHTILEWDLPFAKWFVGGSLNVSVNCLDRHVQAGQGQRVAYHWEGEPGDHRTITYADLLDEVQRFANVLKGLGVARGDRVAIYMPMIPELPVALLACARIGATHSVVFGGFSVEALRGRIQDATAKVVITADGGFRRGEPAALKPTVDESVKDCPSVEHVLVVRRTGQDVGWEPGRDLWWHETVGVASDQHTAQPFDAEHPLFILYTSGTTAKPKGILHTTGGYLTQVAWTHHAVFDLKPNTDVYWCTADIGWVTGHSYIVYGPLTNGATSVRYE
jgi:acetyl-CoA synthetase